MAYYYHIQTDLFVEIQGTMNGFYYPFCLVAEYATTKKRNI
ncbi:hypothetical protein [Candidatus Spongiihabitans sp.]